MALGATGRRYRTFGRFHTGGIALAAARTISGVTFTAVNRGTGGNSITVAITAGGAGATNRPLSVTVSGNAITINPATDGTGTITTTQAAARDAVNAHATAKTLVTASGGTATVIASSAALALTGGQDWVVGHSR